MNPITENRGIRQLIAALRNVRIDLATGSVLVFFALNLAVIAALGFVASRSASEAMDFIHQVDSEQLNQISRADAQLNAARLTLESAASYLGSKQEALGNRELEGAKVALAAAQERFNRFVEAPKSEEAQALADEVVTNFQQIFELVEEQHQVLAEGYIEDFGFIRSELAPPTNDFQEAVAAFVAFAENSVAETVSGHSDQVASFARIGVISMVLSALFLGLIYFGLRKIVIEPLRDAVAKINYIADADLSHDLDDMGNNEIGQLFSAMKRMRHSLSDIVAEVRSGSDSIHTGAREIAAGNADLSARTEQQASSLEETATSMEQLTATVKQNAENAQQASAMANEASSTASRGGEVVNQVIGTMRDISDSSKKITEITGLIDSIAFQTNILALNASVEAARAGEQGRGFAVVAGEVRNLAGRSSEAAKEIKQLIENSVRQVQTGSTLVGEAGETMKEVVTAVRRVTDIMDEISSASREQSGGIEQVSQAVGQMDEVTQQNASLVQEAATAAASLEEQASRLEEIVSIFRLSDDGETYAKKSEERPAVAPKRQSAEAKKVNGANRSPSGVEPKPVVAATQRSAEPEWVEF